MSLGASFAVETGFSCRIGGPAEYILSLMRSPSYQKDKRAPAVHPDL
jgi:hypothetical protein